LKFFLPQNALADTAASKNLSPTASVYKQLKIALNIQSVISPVIATELITPQE
jgi:hypothetical protein